MNKKLSVLITGLAVVIVLVVGMVLVPIAGANPDPTVPPGYFAEIYASVTDPMTLSFDGDGNLFGIVQVARVGDLHGHVVHVVVAGVLLRGPAPAAQFESVGSLEFPTSARSAEAQQHFLRGVAILHSFGWKQAITQFRAAQTLEPDFALAYWGETLCYNHPLFSTSPDDDNPRAALARLGATPAERVAKAPTPREKGFIQAVVAL